MLRVVLPVDYFLPCRKMAVEVFRESFFFGDGVAWDVRAEGCLWGT